MAPLRLISLHISPWSERARWALDHHRLIYQREEHVVFFGERKLRKLTGKPRNTVPILVADGAVLADSWDIARYADRIGASASLFPQARYAEIERLARTADRLMTAGRGPLARSLLRDPEALDASLPPQVPLAARPLLRPLVRRVTRFFATKYGVLDEANEAREREAVQDALDELQALGLSPGRPLFESFSYADILVATALQGISPVADRHLRLPPATRRVWTQPALAQRCAGLVAWRDWLYEEFRRPQKA